MRRAVVRKAIGAAAVAALTLSCGAQADRARPAASTPAELGTLEAEVGPRVAPAVLVAVDQLAARCTDLANGAQAAEATARAGREAGLARDDERWGLAARLLVEGLSRRAADGACTASLPGWLAGALVPPTIPTTAAPTSTTVDPTVDMFADPAPPASAERFRELRAGMELAEVQRLLGSEGFVIDESGIGRHRDEFRRWPAEGAVFAAIYVQFRDQRVVAATTTGDR